MHPRDIKSIVAFIITLSFLLTTYYFHQVANEGLAHSQQSEARDNSGQQSVLHTWSSLLPRKIWQIYLTPPSADNSTVKIESRNIADVISWLALSPDYQYTLVGDEGARSIVRRHFNDDPTLRKIFEGLRNTGMKSDLLRYLILLAEGGIYSDLDTVALKPIELWVPQKYQHTVRVVIGVEFDRLDGKNLDEVHPDLQFCQWTIAAAPGHPLLSDMTQRAVSAIEASMKNKNSTVSSFRATSSEVMKLTGPAAWTDAVFRQLQQYDPDLVSLRDLSGLSEPLLVGDILILPIDAFGMGQFHSNSTHDGSIPEGALVKHGFRGSWRDQDRD